MFVFVLVCILIIPYKRYTELAAQQYPRSKLDGLLIMISLFLPVKKKLTYPYCKTSPWFVSPNISIMRSAQYLISLTIFCFFSQSLHVYLSITYTKLKAKYVNFKSVLPLVKICMKKIRARFFQKVVISYTVLNSCWIVEFLGANCGLWGFCLFVAMLFRGCVSFQLKPSQCH